MIDTKYASSEVSGKIRNEMNREMNNEGKKVSGKELNRLEKERVKNRREAEKAATDFVRDVSRFSTQKNINSITEEICNEAM